MAIKADIDKAIEGGNLELAQELYEDVLAKNDGHGLSGHDQQIYAHLFERMKLAEPEPEPEEVVEEPKRSRKAKA